MKVQTCVLAAVLFAVSMASATEPLVKLEKGDHICIIGNGLAERMQHDGWLETLIYARNPELDLVIRNLGFTGDTVTVRDRSMDFGTPDQWLAGSAPIPQAGKLREGAGVRQNRFELTNTKADVILAFYGFGESFAGPAGVEQFKKDLDAWVKHTLGQKYNGKSAPRLVLFSPIAHEDLHEPNLPNGAAHNANLKLYTAAMGEVAGANSVPFVDLFAPTLDLYKQSGPWTIDGVHLNEAGNYKLAQIINGAPAGTVYSPADRGAGSKELQPLRQAVLDKDFFWFNRYRTTDGYSTYGDRAFLTFIRSNPTSRTEGGIGNLSDLKKGKASEVLPQNYEVLHRELEVLDVMTSNRDQHIWSIARGHEAKVSDTNVPPFIPSKTNFPGPNPDGSHNFLSGTEAITKMKVGKGLKVNLYASEEMFPEMVNPVQMAWDTKGRLWVAAWATYPHWQPVPGTRPNDKLLILEDTNGDGVADKCATFAGDLHNPTGFEFYNGGVIVAQGPEILFLKDTNGDDRYDVKEHILGGFDTADTHHTANSFVIDPGGALYFQEGIFMYSHPETPYGVVRNWFAGVWRFEPRTRKLEVYANMTFPPFANPHGHVFDHWGQDIIHDGTSAQPHLGATISVHNEYPAQHPAGPLVYNQRTRPCSGTEILSTRQFPDDFQGNLLVGNVIGFQGILRYKLDEAGSGLKGKELEPILSSSDPNFRPTDVEIGPDGAIYLGDWQNPIIGHMQHNLRDPNRDKVHGRVYRVTYEGRPLLKPAKIAGEPIEKLLELLKEPEDRVRYRAKIELGGRDSSQVISAVDKWAASLDGKDPDYEHHMLEVLWLHQYHNVVNEDLLKRELRSPEPRTRAAATRVLCYWRDRVKDPLGLLKAQVSDENPRVRLEAVRACSFFQTPMAADVALDSANLPQDEFLKYALDETMKTLEKYSK